MLINLDLPKTDQCVDILDWFDYTRKLTAGEQPACLKFTNFLAVLSLRQERNFTRNASGKPTAKKSKLNMPVTKTAKRALRGSERKRRVNQKLLSRLEIATRLAKKDRTEKSVKQAISLVDRAAKKKIIHKNKAARLKSLISKFSAKRKSFQKTRKSPGKTG